MTFRHGDLIITPTLNSIVVPKLDHLVLAEGEKTGHKHQIISGRAELFRIYDLLYLKVLSATAILSHEEHDPLSLPRGNWEIRIQREYTPPDYRYLID